MLATDLPMSPVRAALAEVETALGPQQQQAFTFAPTAPTGAAAAAAAGAAAAPRAAAQPAAAASVSVPRNTAVVLPVTPDTEVPDWFFQATGAELKEMWCVLRMRTV